MIKNVLLPAIKRQLKDYTFKPAPCKSIEIDIENIENIEFINQNSIKKSSKSTPMTYIGCFDSIRLLFASQKIAKIKNLTSKYFSFNVSGGRCENCKGHGYIIIEMQFLADIQLICEVCNGQRYNEEVLKVKFENNNISDVLNFTIEEAYDFFIKYHHKNITNQMSPLLSVGLGYLRLGQPINTLSSGELQRLKIASFLNEKKGKSILIFDEPTKGLHFHDIKILIKTFEDLVKNGNTVIVIEHNLDIIKNVDWVIDLGPEGGNNGGQIMFSGDVDELVKEKSYTGLALKQEFNYK